MNISAVEVVAMQTKILDAIRLQKIMISGHAGGTPISNLANEFNRFGDTEVETAIRAIADLVDNPPKILPDNFWWEVVFLENYLPETRRHPLIEKFRKRLFGEARLDPMYRSLALAGFIGSGGTVTEEELLGELRLFRTSHTFLWVDAAVRSSLFAFAKKQLHLLLVKEYSVLSTKTDLSVLTGHGCLIVWEGMWPDKSEFVKMIVELATNTPSEKERERITEWLRWLHPQSIL